MGRNELRSFTRKSSVGTWGRRTACFLTPLMIWMLSGCAKAPPRNPLPEDQLVDPVKAGCVCNDIDLSGYTFVGVRKWERTKAWLDRCEADGLIVRTIKEAEVFGGEEMKCLCKAADAKYFKVVNRTDLSRMDRDVETCRAKMMIRELNE